MKKLVRMLLMTVTLTLLPGVALAQSASGECWEVLEIMPGARLRLAVHIPAAPGGRLTGRLDRLDQNVMGLALAM